MGEKRHQKSRVGHRSFKIGNRKTSVSVESEFWNDLKKIAASNGIPLAELVAAINRDRQHGNLSSAIRLFVLEYYRARAGSGRSAENPDTGRDLPNPRETERPPGVR
jgi:predicted DNA-binding ribbon-helix-helix protein